MGTQDKEIQVAQPPVSKPKRFLRQQIPDNILNDEGLKHAIKVLPSNYNFEIMKTVWRLRKANAKRVAMQFPEGLLMYACVLSDILEAYANVEQTFILGDATYGACCVDDFSASAVGADFLLHYGHSCLVPVSHTTVPCLYVFVDIQVDLLHLVETIKLNFRADKRLGARAQLQEAGFQNVEVPQERPLSSGETLGCTAPRLSAHGTDGFSPDALVFVADGRFHLEAMMIANPTLEAFRYDPYGRVLTKEEYDQGGMRAARKAAILCARSCHIWGLVLGTLGRQGNPGVADRLEHLLTQAGKECTLVLVSELSPEKIELMPDIQAWVQVACPRLSIDWGEGFRKPVLTPYEAMVCLGSAPAWWAADSAECVGDSVAPYPMDYYSKTGGEWSSTYHRPKAAPGVSAMPVTSS